MKKFDLNVAEAHRARARAMRGMKARGMVGPDRVLSRAWDDRDGKFAEDGPRQVD